MNLSREYARVSDQPARGAQIPSGDEADSLPAIPDVPVEGRHPPEQGAGKIVNSLVAVLRAEAAMLESGHVGIDGTLTRQKLQLMMQLNRIDPRGEDLAEPTRRMLGEAKRLLDGNARILERRMTAIREIATMISQKISESQSDGTYEVSVSSRGYGSL